MAVDTEASRVVDMAADEVEEDTEVDAVEEDTEGEDADMEDTEVEDAEEEDMAAEEDVEEDVEEVILLRATANSRVQVVVEEEVAEEDTAAEPNRIGSDSFF